METMDRMDRNRLERGELETKTIELPIAVIENWDRRLALLQGRVQLLQFLVDEIRVEEAAKRWRLFGLTN